MSWFISQLAHVGKSDHRVVRTRWRGSGDQEVYLSEGGGGGGVHPVVHSVQEQAGGASMCGTGYPLRDEEVIRGELDHDARLGRPPWSETRLIMPIHCFCNTR